MMYNNDVETDNFNNNFKNGFVVLAPVNVHVKFLLRFFIDKVCTIYPEKIQGLHSLSRVTFNRNHPYIRRTVFVRHSFGIIDTAVPVIHKECNFLSLFQK